MIGETVSHFQILSELGRGGMGVVYRAHDQKLDRDVALKFLPANLTRDATARARFEHEARAVSRIEHPAICSIFEIGVTDEGQTFMVMPCYEGQTLAERLEEGPMTVDASMGIFRQLAQGLSSAHSRGIVHRDIKPANIFLTEEGQVKILDFGLAKLAGQTRVTREGTTLGTVAYMSPEQAQGKEAGIPSDIWSLGTVLFEMLAGRPAFAGDHAQAVLYAIQMTDPDPPADLPEEIGDLLAGLLKKDPDHRHGWSEASLSGYTEIGDWRPVTAEGDPRSRLFKPRNLAFGGIVVGAALIFSILNCRPGNIEALAVLPFENLSGNVAEEYYADGMTGQLISRLGSLKIFDRVISRRSVMQYKGESRHLKEIGEELGVQAIVEGSVMLFEDRVQVTVFLLDPQRDRQLWTNTFDEPQANILDIQNRIVAAIARAVSLELDENAQKRLKEMGTVDPAAHKACLRGFHWLEAYETDDEWDLAEEYFNSAIKADSTYALAWAGLGEWLVRSMHIPTGPPPGFLDRARDAVDQAIELDPELAEAHMTRGHLLWEHQFEIEEAGRSLDRAIELNPSLAYAHGMRAYYFESLGRYEESAAAAMKTIELDPNLLFMHAVIFEPLMLAEKYDEALEQIRNTRKKFPAWKGWRYQKSLLHEFKKDYPGALAAIGEDESEPLSRREMSRKTYLLIKNDRLPEARQLFAEYKVLADRDSVFSGVAEMALDLGDTATSKTYIGRMEESNPRPVMQLAPIYGRYNDLDKAFQCLEEAYDTRNNWVTRLGMYPEFFKGGWAILAEDPRYEELMKRIGIR